MGHNGKVVTQIYFPAQYPDDSTTSSPSATQSLSPSAPWSPEINVETNFERQTRISLRTRSLHRKLRTIRKRDAFEAGPWRRRGLPYGDSCPAVRVYGDEIRPALPITTSDPVVYPWQRPESEGKEVIEITIDERGEIVRKTVLQSLGPEIDERVPGGARQLAFSAGHAQWQVPIPSKQDAIFPFKARG